MNDILKDKLRIIASDEYNLMALKAILDEELEGINKYIDLSQSNQLVGEQYRAWAVSKIIMDEVLKKISDYKENRKMDNKFNKEK